MIRRADHKLVYYSVGNHTQLFDLREDPTEMRDRAHDPAYAGIREELSALLVQNLYGSDLEWLKDGRLVGLPEVEGPSRPPGTRGLNNQRGWRFR